MKKKNRASVKVDPFLEGMMAKLLDRLVSLEKKVDALLSRGAGAGNALAKAEPRHERTLYEAICAECGKVCEVPFRPSEDRAVYCKQCFALRKSGGSQPKPKPKPSKNFPVLTPVALPPRPPSAILASSLISAAYTPAPSKKAKKSKPAKKAKKKR